MGFINLLDLWIIIETSFSGLLTHPDLLGNFPVLALKVLYSWKLLSLR